MIRTNKARQKARGRLGQLLGKNWAASKGLSASEADALADEAKHGRKNRAHVVSITRAIRFYQPSSFLRLLERLKELPRQENRNALICPD